MISESCALRSVSGKRLSSLRRFATIRGTARIAPTPRHPLLQAAACTDATLRLRRGHRRTTCRMSRSAQSPDERSAHRWATPPDTSAPAPRSCLSLLPPTLLTPPFYARWNRSTAVSQILERNDRLSYVDAMRRQFSLACRPATLLPIAQPQECELWQKTGLLQHRPA